MLSLLWLLLPVIGSLLILRSVHLITSSLQNNAASFVNTSSDNLHIRRISIEGVTRGVIVAGDEWRLSVDEIPAQQMGVNDSRNHLLGVNMINNTITTSGALNGAIGRKVRHWSRNDLVLRPDDAIFINLQDVVGAPTVSGQVDIEYED